MEIIIIFAICLFVIWALKKLVDPIFLYSVVEGKYQAFKKLTYNYPTQRLLVLRKDLNKVVLKLQKIIQTDEDVKKYVTSIEDKAFWQKEIEHSKKMLQEFEEELKDVERELSRREFFNSKW